MMTVRTQIITSTFSIVEYNEKEKTIILSDPLGEQATFPYHDTKEAHQKVVYMTGERSGKTLINLTNNTVTNLDSELSKAFMNGDYDVCEVLLQNGASKQILMYAERRLKREDMTQEQQNILRFLRD